MGRGGGRETRRVSATLDFFAGERWWSWESSQVTRAALLDSLVLLLHDRISLESWCTAFH